MKKSLFALAALGAVSGVAHADVTLYGILDAGIVQMTNAGNISPNFVTGAVPTGGPYNKIGTTVGMMNGGESQTRWGIRGSEDLGNGNKAFFQLESAINLGSGTLGTSGLAGAGCVAGSKTCTFANGSAAQNANAMVADTSLNGQLFGRNAYVGLSNHDLGALTLGRQNSLQLDVITATGGGYDPVNAQMFSPINFSGFYGGGGETDNARVDSAVKYANKFGNVNVNVLYGFGGMANSSSARSNVQANIGYEADRFGVQLTSQVAKDTTGINPNPNPNTVNVTFVDLTSYMATLRYRVIDPLTLRAGYERVEISAPSNPAADLTMSQIYGYTIGNPGTGSLYNDAQKNINVYWIGGNYEFSQAWKLSVGYYDAETPAWGTHGSGTDKYISALVDYNLSKRTNLYAGWMQDKKSGTSLAYPSSIDTYQTYGIGIRHKF
ncbi:MAG: porin [Betaproteobacteria bacterium]|nr:porin [Betaproteobacteria bacterium]